MPNQLNLTNETIIFEHDTFMESFLKNVDTDCIVYSEEGVKFNIHKEILYQTKLMKNILEKDDCGCRQNLEIFFPCPENELEAVLNFLYNGTNSYNEETEVSKILFNLIEVFGFPENLFSILSDEAKNMTRISVTCDLNSNFGLSVCHSICLHYALKQFLST